MGNVDDSFRKPGAVPFKWETKPGVPKPHHDPARDPHRSSRKLTPPPSGVHSTPPPDLGPTRSFRSVTRFRPRVEPMAVSAGCFFSPLFRRRWGKKSKKVDHKASPEYEPFHLSTLARWTDSSRKSLSLWESSTCSSSFSSYRSSPQPVQDPEWAGFGLF